MIVNRNLKKSILMDEIINECKSNNLFSKYSGSLIRYKNKLLSRLLTNYREMEVTYGYPFPCNFIRNQVNYYNDLVYYLNLDEKERKTLQNRFELESDLNLMSNALQGVDEKTMKMNLINHNRIYLHNDNTDFQNNKDDKDSLKDNIMSMIEKVKSKIDYMSFTDFLNLRFFNKMGLNLSNSENTELDKLIDVMTKQLLDEVKLGLVEISDITVLRNPSNEWLYCIELILIQYTKDIMSNEWELKPIKVNTYVNLHEFGSIANMNNKVYSIQEFMKSVYEVERMLNSLVEYSIGKKDIKNKIQDLEWISKDSEVTTEEVYTLPMKDFITQLNNLYIGDVVFINHNYIVNIADITLNKICEILYNEPIPIKTSGQNKLKIDADSLYNFNGNLINEDNSLVDNYTYNSEKMRRFMDYYKRSRIYMTPLKYS